MGTMTSHLLPHIVVERSIKLIYVKVLSKLNNAMQMWVIISAVLARHLIFHYLLDKLVQGEEEKTQGMGLAHCLGQSRELLAMGLTDPWLVRKHGDFVLRVGRGSVLSFLIALAPLTPAQLAASELRRFWVCLLTRIREVQQPRQQDLKQNKEQPSTTKAHLSWQNFLNKEYF